MVINEIGNTTAAKLPYKYENVFMKKKNINPQSKLALLLIEITSIAFFCSERWTLSDM